MGTWELVIRSGFSATHSLRLGAAPREPLHTHQWQAEVFLTGSELDADGLVADFSMLKERLGQITGTLEGQCLDELPAFSGCNASTELIARHLYDRYRPTLPPAVRLVKVRVWETENCAAAYQPGEQHGEGGP